MTQHKRLPQIGPRLGLFVLTLLLIEFLDEFVYGAREAAWPLIRADLGLSYAQIGALLGVPAIVSSVVEPILGVLGDAWKRRALVLGGGALFCLSLLLTSVSHSFTLLLLSFILFYPACGAFVSLSQATLMDVGSTRREHNMARWTLAGSLGVVVGPLVLGAAVALGMGWRTLFAGFAALALLLLVLASCFRFGDGRTEEEVIDLKTAFAGVWQALKRGAVLRWLVLLQFSDLMLDVLLGYLALYFVDVVGVTAGQAATAVAVWTGVGLLGDVLLIPLLERVPGLRYLRLSAAIKLVLFPAFLLVPAFGVKLALLGLLGLFNAGWYAILKAQLYSTMPGQSGTTMAVDNIFGFIGALVPWGLGLIAGRFGLQVTMWLLLLGPLVLMIGLPRTGQSTGR
ncbi:MAG: MFS transporter [Anaerolineae bacterium]|mgnify:CR=1 FL=1